jgi:hypothetical protein
LKERRELSRTFWNVFMTKVRENNYGINFLDHKKFPFFKAIERKAEGGGKPICSAYGIFLKCYVILFYFILFYFWEAQGQT